MSARFSFSIDRQYGLVRIAMGGLFGPADIADFLDARREAHAALGLAPNRHMTLNDMREIKIQTQGTVTAFQQILADPAYRSRRSPSSCRARWRGRSCCARFRGATAAASPRPRKPNAG